MTTLIDISNEPGERIFIDAARVSIVQEFSDAQTLDKKGFLQIITADGKTEYVMRERHGLTAADVAQKLAAAGYPLAPAGGNSFIAPSFACYMTTSVQGGDGLQGAIVGMQGYGRFQTEATPERLAELLQKMQRSKDYLAFAPADASARWYKPEMLHIAASEVEMMVQDRATQIHVHFKNAGSLDVHPPQPDREALAQSLQKSDPTLSAPEAASDARRRIDSFRGKKMKMLIAALAKACPQVMEVPNEELALYVTPAIVDRVVPLDGRTEYEILLHTRPRFGDRYGEAQRAYYATAAQRDRALEAICLKLGVQPAPAVRPTPK